MKKLSLFKNTDKQEGTSQPDYRLVASYQDGSGNWVNETVGSFWKNQTDNPNAPTLSGKMSEAREYQGKQYPGWKIEPDGVSQPQAPQNAPQANSAASTAPVNAGEDNRQAPDYPEEEINPADIPF